MLGDQITLFVLPTVAIVSFGASGAQVGLLQAVNTLAYPALGLFAGVLMDRIRRRPAMITADLVRAAAFGSIPLAAAFGSLSMPHLYAVAFVAGAFAVLFDVASQSHLPSLVPRDMLSGANARMEMSSTIALLSGATVGGLLVQLFSGVGALTANAISFLFSVLGIISLRTPEPPPAEINRGKSVRKQMREGLAALWRDPILRPLTFAAGLRNLGMAAVNAVLLLFAYRTLQLTPGVTGLLFTAGAAAAVVGAMLTRRVVRWLGPGRTLLLTAAEGAVWLAVPLALVLPPIPTLLVLLVLSSMWLPLWNATVTTLRQSVTPPHLLGRVHASARTVNMSTIPVGALLGGVLADLSSAMFGQQIGLTVALTLGGLVAALGFPVLLASASVRTLREMPRQASVAHGPASTDQEDR